MKWQDGCARVMILPTDRFHSVFRLYEETEGFMLTNDLEIHFLELPKLGETDVQLDDPLVSWLLFVGAKDERTVEELAKQEPVLRKAKTVLEFLNQSDEARKLYEMRVKALKDEMNMIEGAKEEGRAEGIAEGKEEGKLEGKAEVAKNLLALGMSVQEVAKLTGLPVTELEKLDWS
jgi:predicted transposase/invertase (TIGR01784 family)